MQKKEQLIKELLDLAIKFTLGVYTGINPKYPDSHYFIDLEKMVDGWIIKGCLYTNVLVTTYMKEDGTFSFDPYNRHYFGSINEAITAFCGEHDNRERRFK